MQYYSTASSAREEFEILVRSEYDCRQSITAVLRDTQFALLCRCLSQLETAWRQNFFVSVNAFQRATRNRTDTLRREAELQEKRSYRTFAEHAEMVSQWYDALWAAYTDDVVFFVNCSSLQSEELCERDRILNTHEVTVCDTLLTNYHESEMIRKKREGLLIIHLSRTMLKVAQATEDLLATFVMRGNQHFCNLALTISTKYAFDLYRLSEMEMIKYRWALMYRMEHAHRRYVVWHSLLSACRLAESWERLYVLNVYSRRTGELLWFHDEQRILVVLDDESKFRSVVVAQEEQRERVKLVSGGFVASLTLAAKSLVLFHKELVSRSQVELSAQLQRQAIERASSHSGSHILSVLTEHNNQRALLHDNEATARRVLEEFLLNHNQLLVRNWLQTELSTMRDLAAGKAMVSFDPYWDRGFERTHVVQEAEQDAATWDYVYGAPMIPRTDFDSTFNEWGATGPLVHHIHSAPPPYSAAAMERRLLRGRSTSPEKRSSPRRPANLSSPRWRSDQSPHTGDDNGVFSSSSSEDGDVEEDKNAADQFRSEPFFASGGSPKLALGVVALECDEERSRAFFEREALLSHVTLVTHVGFQALEEGLRFTITNRALEEKRTLFRMCIFQYRMAVIIAQEHSMRRRILNHETEESHAVFACARLSKSTITERHRMITTFLQDREMLFCNYFLARYSSNAKHTSDAESASFQSIALKSNAENLALTIEANRLIFTPALRKLQQKEQEIEEQLSTAHHNGGAGHWYDVVGPDPSLSPIRHNNDDEPQGVEFDDEAVRFFDASKRSYPSDSDASLEDFTMLHSEQVDLLHAQEFNARKAATLDFQLSRATLMLHVLPMIEELHRYDRMNEAVHALRKFHRRGFTGLSIQAIVEVEQTQREIILDEQVKRSRTLDDEYKRLTFTQNYLSARKRLHQTAVDELSTLKVDVLFTLFFQEAVEMATKEDTVFADIQDVCNSQLEQLLDRKRLFFGLRLSDGLFLPGGIAATKPRKEKELYYHIRVTDSAPPARPLIQRNDIILAVQGCPVVTLASMKQALRMVKSNVAHFTILRARDGTTTTISVAGVYRDEPPSRSESHVGF